MRKVTKLVALFVVPDSRLPRGGGKKPAGRVGRRFDPGSCTRGPVGLSAMRVESVLKASPIPLTPLAFRALVRRFDGGEGGLEEPYRIAARRWEKMEEPSALSQ